jgi:hypothetical protein
MSVVSRSNLLYERISFVYNGKDDFIYTLLGVLRGFHVKKPERPMLMLNK